MNERVKELIERLAAKHGLALNEYRYLIENRSGEAAKRVGYDIAEHIPKEKVRGIARENIAAIKSSDRRNLRF